MAYRPAALSLGGEREQRPLTLPSPAAGRGNSAPSPGFATLSLGGERGERRAARVRAGFNQRVCSVAIKACICRPIRLIAYACVHGTSQSDAGA